MARHLQKKSDKEKKAVEKKTKKGFVKKSTRKK